MSGILARGTKLQMGNGASPEVFTTIGHAKKIGGVSMSRGEVDVTDHDSTSKETITEPFYDPGSIDFDGNFDPANTTHQALLTAFKANTEHNWKVIFPDDALTELTFPGYVSKLTLGDAPHDGVLGFSGSVRISAAVSDLT